jgi:hypothetical protein
MSNEKEKTMGTAVAGVKLVGPDNGREGFLGSIGVRFLIDGIDASEQFSLVEHPMSPRALAAPLHRHTREDEYSFVLEGRMGALLGDEPCRILEIISPAGFERFFQELSDLGGVLEADPAVVAELSRRYGLELRPDTVPGLLERFGLNLGRPLPGGWRPPR